jgi:hypothetical protein
LATKIFFPAATTSASAGTGFGFLAARAGAVQSSAGASPEYKRHVGINKKPQKITVRHVNALDRLGHMI